MRIRTWALPVVFMALPFASGAARAQGKAAETAAPAPDTDPRTPLEGSVSAPEAEMLEELELLIEWELLMEMDPDEGLPIPLNPGDPETER